MYFPYIHKLCFWHLLSFYGLDESFSKVGAEPMMFSKVFKQNVIKRSTISSSFCIKFPLLFKRYEIIGMRNFVGAKRIDNIPEIFIRCFIFSRKPTKKLLKKASNSVCFLQSLSIFLNSKKVSRDGHLDVYFSTVIYI